MKEKRNCGMTYPSYPQPMMPPIMPPMQVPFGYQGGYPNNGSVSSNTIEQQLNNMFQQINNLEARVTKLESMASSGNTTTYNDSNYYMV